MTIREYLKRRVRMFFGLAIVGWLICAGSMFFMNPFAHCRPHCATHGAPLPLLLGFPVFFGAILGLALFVRCPRCKGRFGALAGTLVVRGFLARTVNFCPYCGVSLDANCDVQHQAK